MTNVIGEYPELTRIETGLYSFDRAVGNPHSRQLGYPTKSVIEIYGNQGIGKSTLSYFLSGRRNESGKILICDLEGLDRSYLPIATAPAKFDGTIEIINAMDNKGKMRSHEAMINELTDRVLEEEDIQVGILDSVGAILPTFQQASEIGEGFGAKRAIIVAQFARKAALTVNNKPTLPNIFAVNHSHVIVSGGVGHQSAGGVVLGFLGAVRLYLRYASRDFIKTADEVLAYMIEGTVEKLRYGGKGRKFKVAIIPGHGVRPNLTAVQDCVDLGLAERGAVVKMEDTSFGYISKMVEDDLEGRDNKFDAFYEAIEKHKKGGE